MPQHDRSDHENAHSGRARAVFVIPSGSLEHSSAIGAAMRPLIVTITILGALFGCTDPSSKGTGATAGTAGMASGRADVGPTAGAGSQAGIGGSGGIGFAGGAGVSDQVAAGTGGVAGTTAGSAGTTAGSSGTAGGAGTAGDAGTAGAQDDAGITGGTGGASQDYEPCPAAGEACVILPFGDSAGRSISCGRSFHCPRYETSRTSSCS